ncbi:response regulator [Arcobacter sp. LA11]|uniref:response regulator n=1 Tax=Arcobacter sp. LA11 TaxID=1898176 RepID=UPI00093281B7|nr:response regulator [Arcobacter sp. LA11]
MKKFPNLYDNNTSVLIVEDEAVLAMGMEYSLEEFGYEVTGIETTADAAIKHANINNPDIILMDIKLKGEKTGIDAAKEIWAYNKIPIVFLTSFSDDKTIKNAMESEPYGYLIKPCRDEELKVAIETALHKHKYFFKNKDSLEINKKTEKKIACIEGYSFNKAKKILFKNDLPIKLTGNESKLFDILSDYPNEPVSFEKINNYIWRDDYTDIGKLRTLVYRIKNKLGTNLIENIFELGYKLKIN